MTIIFVHLAELLYILTDNREKAVWGPCGIIRL